MFRPAPSMDDMGDQMGTDPSMGGGAPPAGGKPQKVKCPNCGTSLDITVAPDAAPQPDDMQQGQPSAMNSSMLASKL